MITFGVHKHVCDHFAKTNIITGIICSYLFAYLSDDTSISAILMMVLTF